MELGSLTPNRESLMTSPASLYLNLREGDEGDRPPLPYGIQSAMNHGGYKQYRGRARHDTGGRATAPLVCHMKPKKDISGKQTITVLTRLEIRPADNKKHPTFRTLFTETPLPRSTRY